MILSRLKISDRMWLMSAVSALLFFAAVAVGWYGLAASRSSLQAVYANRVIPLYDLSALRQFNANSVSRVLRALAADPSARGGDSGEILKKNSTAEDELWNQYTAIPHGADETKAMSEFAGKRAAWDSKLNAAANDPSTDARGKFSTIEVTKAANLASALCFG